jgi:branched-chain amino acid transport system substrate-binding protein
VEGVDAIADLPVTSVAFAVQDLAREKKKVLLINAAAADELTGEACSPYTIHWQDDSRALSVGTTQAVLASGLKRWLFLTPDYAWGQLMEAAATRTIRENGGTVVGSLKFPLGISDYSSALLAAEASKAEVYATGTVGNDTLNLLKQASEFHLAHGSARIVVFQIFLPEIHSLGLAQAQGLYVTDGFYWDKNEVTRAWSRAFFARHGKMPSKSQAYTYLSVMHYLKAVQSSGADDAETVSRAMKSMPADDFGEQVRIRANGRVMYDLALYEVKSPQQSKYPWDYYRFVRAIPAAVAFGGSDRDTCAR